MTISGTLARISLTALLLVASGCAHAQPPQAQSTGESFAEQTTPVGQASAPALAPSARPVQSTTPPPNTSGANAGNGKQLYAANCASCHGTSGEGGVGPSLHNEQSRKNLQQAIAWIKNPQPPMPKLYPAPLSDRDVRDVAAFVESL